MKKRLILSILLLAAFGLQARAQRKIAGTRTADFTIVYCSALEDEEGIDAARTLRQELAGAEQPELRILPDTAFRRGRAIRLVRSEDRAPFDYAVRVSRGDLLIDGGGSWALTKAAQHVAQMLREGDIPRDAHIEGSVEGECLFARAAGSNLRILAESMQHHLYDKLAPYCHRKSVHQSQSAQEQGVLHHRFLLQNPPGNFQYQQKLVPM